MKLINQMSQLIYRIGKKKHYLEWIQVFWFWKPRKISTSFEVKTKLTLEIWLSYPKKNSFDCVIFRGNYVCFLPFFEVVLLHLSLKIWWKRRYFPYGIIFLKSKKRKSTNRTSLFSYYQRHAHIRNDNGRYSIGHGKRISQLSCHALAFFGWYLYPNVHWIMVVPS